MSEASVQRFVRTHGYSAILLYVVLVRESATKNLVHVELREQLLVAGAEIREEAVKILPGISV